MMCSYDSCGSAMNRQNPCDKCSAGIMVLVGIIGGIIFSIGVTLTVILSAITLLQFVAFTTLIFGLVFLFTIIVGSAASNDFAECVRCSFGGLMFGILGTIFSSFFGIVIGIISLGIFDIIILAVIAFFFAYTVISGLFFARCLSRC